MPKLHNKIQKSNYLRKTRGKNIQAIRGMNDCSPTESPLWQWIEGQVRQILSSYGYSEVRMPIVESTPLFARAIGEVTDVVSKEMYTFWDNDEQLTLRPEGTASACELRLNTVGFTTMNNVYGTWDQCSAMSVRKRSLSSIPSSGCRSIWYRNP